MPGAVARAYTVNAPDVLAEDFDGQVVVLNLANGHYYSVHGAGSPLWILVAGGYGPDAIRARLATERPELIEAAMRFIDELVALNLVVEAPAGVAPTSEIAVVWPNEPPRLEVFEDLAELITADPVHDVEPEAGWPTLRAQS